MNKSADAFRTIGEVAEELDVPKHVLRFWEGKFPQIKPMKRGGGRRYYRPEDMALLRGIRHLLHAEGYTIKGVQKILREHGIEQVKVLARGAQAPARRTDAAKSAPSMAGEDEAAAPTATSRADAGASGGAGFAPPPVPRNELGTEYGQSQASSVHEVEFKRKHKRRPDAVFAVYYDSAQGLAARGIPLAGGTAFASAPEPFPDRVPMR